VSESLCYYITTFIFWRIYKLTKHKGVWIPIEILHDSNLTMKEKVLLMEINQLSMLEKGCVAHNEHFGELLQMQKENISRLITSLKDKGYISVHISKRNHLRMIEVVGGYQNDKGVVEMIRGGYQNDKSLKGIKPINKTSIVSESKNDSSTDTIINKYAYNPNINENQMAFLKRIVSEFYQTKHKQYPNHIKSNWHEDDKLTHESVNVLYQLITIDKWGENDVRDVIRWATTDTFWQSNLLSLRILRIKSKNGMTKFANLHLKFTQ